MHLSPPPPVVLAAVRSKAVVLLLLIYCLLLLPLFIGVLCFVNQYFTVVWLVVLVSVFDMNLLLFRYTIFKGIFN